MLTVWCLLVELVSQFLLTINPRVYRFLVAGTSAHALTHSCVCLCKPAHDCNNTHLQTETHTLLPRVDIVAFLWVTWAVETCPTVELSMLGRTGLGKWLRCCNVVNKIPCYLTRPSNRAGSNAFPSSPSFCSSEARSMEQSCWYASNGPAQSVYERSERSHARLIHISVDKVTDAVVIYA